MIILIDNGHGINTPGKCSPDGRFKEYAWAREIAKMLYNRLKDSYTTKLITPEEVDISLATRVKRVNDVCLEHGAKNVLLISIHTDAAGADGKWHNARGFSARVGTNASSRSKKLASCLWNRAIEMGLKGNRCVPNEKYIAQNLYILKYTHCPAVLTENLFQDNKDDVDFLLSAEGKKKIVDMHVKGIIDYINYVKKL